MYFKEPSPILGDFFIFTTLTSYAILSLIYNYYFIKGGYPLSVITYKCPHCGGDLSFDPKTQNSKCGYCLSEFTNNELENLSSKQTHDVDAKEILEDDYTSYAAHDDNALLYTCPSCGAEIITNETTSASICCYCHNPVVFSKQLEGEFRPSKVIPFKLTSDQAIHSFLGWRKTKLFLPKDFSSPSQLEKIAGVYIPYWLVDCDITGSMNAHTKNIRTWSDGNYHYTKTDEFAVYREANMSFKSISHDASKKADDKVMDSIGPFNFDELTDFSHSYLSGFLAEKYDVQKEDVYPIIKERVQNAANSTLRSSINRYSSVHVTRSQIRFNKSKFHYALMPVWILTYIYKGKTYLFAMNGQTGKVHGSLPLNEQKLTLFCTGLFIVVFIICLIGAWMI